MQSLVGILFSRLRNEFAFFLILLGSHDRVSSREVPWADIFFEVILPAAACIMEYWGTKMAARRLLMTHLQFWSKVRGRDWDDGDEGGRAISQPQGSDGRLILPQAQG